MRPGEAQSNDHVVPATLISRAQPKAKGFDYGGHLRTHEKCNNRFGDETYASKALDLLRVLNSPRMENPIQHAEHSDISILPIDASLLPHFTARDLKFFEIIDVRNTDIASLSDPNFYADKVKTNPTRSALSASLSVLTKTAAALLIKHHLGTPPSFWRIYAKAYAGNLSGLDLSVFPGLQLSLDAELRVCISELPDENWLVAIAAKDTLVFLAFAFSKRNRVLKELSESRKDSETYVFVGTCISELLITGWRVVYP